MFTSVIVLIAVFEREVKGKMAGANSHGFMPLLAECKGGD